MTKNKKKMEILALQTIIPFCQILDSILQNDSSDFSNLDHLMSLNTSDILLNLLKMYGDKQQNITTQLLHTIQLLTQHDTFKKIFKKNQSHIAMIEGLQYFCFFFQTLCMSYKANKLLAYFKNCRKKQTHTHTQYTHIYPHTNSNGTFSKRFKFSER